MTRLVVDIYSVTLGLALAAALAALGLAAYCWLASTGVLRSAGQARIRRLARGAGLAALGLVLLSTASHLFTGHRPGSSAELAPAAFITEHPTIGVASALAAGALLLLWLTRPTATKVDAPRRGA